MDRSSDDSPSPAAFMNPNLPSPPYSSREPFRAIDRKKRVEELRLGLVPDHRPRE